MRYYLAAAALGAGWIVVLSVPGLTSQAIREFPHWNIAVLILSSLVIARVFKNWISKPGTVVGHTGRAIVITYFGCAVYVTLLNLGFEIESLRHGETETFRDWWPRYFWGTALATCAFYVVIPYSVFCQLVMNRVSRALTDVR